MAAGPAVDELAAEYAAAGQPALFLEQDVNFPLGRRYDRWWAAYGGTSAYLPLVMVDSGHRISSGYQSDFKATYRPLVDAELIRPPQAQIEAFVRQVGLAMRAYVRLLNASGTPLSTQRNAATLHALVWEDARVGVTSRIVRAAPWTAIAPEVAAGGEFTATLETANLASVDWNAIHAVVIADYIPGPGAAYDMLQGAVAEPAGLYVEPESVTLAVDADSPDDPETGLSVRGPYVLNWTAVTDSPWITVTPDSGSVATQPTLTVAAAILARGWQEGAVTFTASSEDGMSFAQTVTVRAFLGARAPRRHLPRGSR